MVYGTRDKNQSLLEGWFLSLGIFILERSNFYFSKIMPLA